MDDEEEGVDAASELLEHWFVVIAVHACSRINFFEIMDGQCTRVGWLHDRNEGEGMAAESLRGADLQHTVRLAVGRNANQVESHLGMAKKAVIAATHQALIMSISKTIEQAMAASLTWVGNGDADVSWKRKAMQELTRIFLMAATHFSSICFLACPVRPVYFRLVLFSGA